MKLILIVIDADDAGEIQKLLDEDHVTGFTRVSQVFGKGEMGSKFGTRAFPGSSCLFMVAVAKETCEEVMADLRELKQSSPDLKVFSLDTTEEV